MKINLKGSALCSSEVLPREQGCFNICFNIYIGKSVHIIHHISRFKGTNHMIISTDAKKAFEKNRAFIHIEKLGIVGIHLNIVKAVYAKSKVNIILNGE